MFARVGKHPKPPKTGEADDQTPRIILTDAAPNIAPTDRETPPETPAIDAKKEFRTLSQVLANLAKHFFITICVVTLGVAMHWVLVHVFDDPKFFDRVPVRYVIDAGDIAVIVTFFSIMIRELVKLKE